MTPLQRYVAEEIATDHADGLMSRREALRRLGLLGLSVGAASALLAACGDQVKEAPLVQSSTPPATITAGPPGAAHAVATQAISFAGPDGGLHAAWAAAESPRGAVLVIHENKGLTDHHKNVAGRFAGAGYSAMALDLLSRNGGTAHFSDPAQATAALTGTPAADLVADIQAAIGELEVRADGKKLAMIGFCFGGGLTWQTLAAGEPRLSAAAPFYGPGPENPDFSGSKNAAVIAFYGALDNRVNATRDAMDEALTQAGLVHEIVTEPDANHAFFNDTGQRYNVVAANDAWKRVLDWFGEHVG
ncbi:dienelactone hydrolase family protein [Smaragdicoccus niigatensis]|uniref:dienelactone hydrolase family protein n=1 Tax=Smaragdicoccus niigatensis TaxID=359359 RepID=UPI000372F7F8|nr:dienelactone hydrolase family protein [Smaragdicoccus niigatensis]